MVEIPTLTVSYIKHTIYFSILKWYIYAWALL